MLTEDTKEKLEQVIRVLEGVPDDKFNIGLWKNDCGTVACAIGWAGSDPWFNERGLSVVCALGWGPLYENPVDYSCHAAFSAVAQFFGIDRDEATYLFAGSSYIDADQSIDTINAVKRSHVIERIRQFIANDGRVG